MNVVNMAEITEYQVVALLEDIGISEFMLPSQCSVDTNGIIILSLLLEIDTCVSK
jgi:hypothetical protein